MIWSRIRQRLGPWIGAALIIAIAAGMFWTAMKVAQGAGGSSTRTAVGDAMSKAARQRMLTP